MKGTLALWYEPRNPPVEERVRVELHLNLWRDLPSRANFLDVGMLFDNPEGMQRFYLYVPATLEAEQIGDLSEILKFTANAVFNDVVELGAEQEGRYETVRSGARDTVFRIHPDDIELSDAGDAVVGAGTRVTFRGDLVSRMHRATGRSYLRFRIRLSGDAEGLFSSEVLAKDRIFLSAAGQLEVTEFRLNERRSYPSRIADRQAEGNFRITRIHYFLIRDLQYQLISQHAPFDKIRRMEAKLWLKYLASAYPEGADRITAELAERLVIYHWKEKERVAANAGQEAKLDVEGGLSDFIAFASFQTTRTKLILYASMIILLGAAGSLLAATGSMILANHFKPSRSDGQPGSDAVLAANLDFLSVVLIVLMAFIFAPVVKRMVGAIWTRTRALGRHARVRLALLKSSKGT